MELSLQCVVTVLFYCYFINFIMGKKHDECYCLLFQPSAEGLEMYLCRSSEVADNCVSSYMHHFLIFWLPYYLSAQWQRFALSSILCCPSSLFDPFEVNSLTHTACHRIWQAKLFSSCYNEFQQHDV